MTKTCFKCGFDKELSEFYSHPPSKDGLLGKCKDCTKADVALNRSKNANRLRDYDRKRFAEKGHRYKDPVGKAREYRHARRAGKGFTAQEFAEICAVYGGVCLACGSDGPLTADHVVPVSKGGANDIINIQPLCGSCNSKKGIKVIDYREGAYAV